MLSNDDTMGASNTARSGDGQLPPHHGTDIRHLIDIAGTFDPVVEGKSGK
jgi:hypothetical protein